MSGTPQGALHRWGLSVELAGHGKMPAGTQLNLVFNRSKTANATICTQRHRVRHEPISDSALLLLSPEGSRRLSITHKLSSDHDPQFDIRQTREPPPDDGVPRRRVVRAVEISSEASKLDDIVAKPASMIFNRACGHEFVQQI